MNTHASSGNSKAVENVSSRVKNTKKEIELLKAQLEKLINEGTQPNKQNPEKNVARVEKQTISKQVVIIPQSSELELKKNVEAISKKSVATKEPIKDESPKKVRSYNVAEARDYIKKQREKRAEQLKAQIDHTDNRLDLKKQKLKELHEKTLALVTKNVQKKRERSKSQERGIQVRPDKTSIRQKSQERLRRDQKPKPQTSVSNLRSKSHERVDRGVESQQNLDNVSNRVSRPRTVKSTISTAISPNFLCPPKTDVDKTIMPPFSNDTVKEKNELDLNKRIIHKSNKKASPDSKSKSKSQENGAAFKSSGRNVKPKSSDMVVELTFENGAISEENKQNSHIKVSHKPKQMVLEHALMTDACVKDSKETQTSQGNNYAHPTWLQPPIALPYPYNFINTVKRKLQYAINSPRNCVDVGVQNSVEFSNVKSQTPESEVVKSKEEIKELLIKSTNDDLKSFASHKRLNLDLKVVDNLELIPHSSLKPKSRDVEAVSKNLFVNYDSESDTSKNIPEISSESLGSSHKLNLDKLKDLKLQPHSSKLSSSSNVKTDTNGYPSWGMDSDDSYSSDFLKETEPSLPKSSGTILTVPSEKKQISELASTSSVGSNSSNKETKGNYSKDSRSTITIRTLENSQKTFRSLLTDEQVFSSGSASEISSAVSQITSNEVNEPLALKEPSVSLSVRKDKNLDLSKGKMKSITIRPAMAANNNVNEIHLKFEAEVRLLNDFNESLKQFMTVEKAFENLKNKNDTNVKMSKIFQNMDTQTSVVTKTSTNGISSEKSSRGSRNSSINYSRGSEEFSDPVVNHNVSNALRNSTFSTEWNLSNFTNSSNMSTGDDSKFNYSISNVENYNVKNCAGLSLNMFEQLIKDEDARIQHLKAIIKIREQALLDRTKGELVWLEIQKKQLIETGKIEEASLLKKKQRGIILKHEQERNEIKKLKQMQKEASEERKNILKQQRNLIKSQLSTENMLSKIRVKTPRERRSSGPLRVMQSCGESIHSETSISRRSSAVEDVFSITSHSIKVSEEFEESDLELSRVHKEKAKVPVSNVKRTLFMREAALQKRRKAAEELLRWHRKLLDEEKKISELEAAATSVINRIPKEPEVVLERYKFNGKQLNQLWRNMTGRDDRKFVEDKVYVMSQITLERFCKSARQYSNKNKKAQHVKNSDGATENSVSETEISGSGLSDSVKKTKVDRSDVAKSISEVNYSSIFDQDSVQEIINSQDEKTKISSISELIDNFSKIEDEISLLSKKSEHDITSLKETEALTVDPSEVTQYIDHPPSESSSQVSGEDKVSVVQTMTPNQLSEVITVETNSKGPEPVDKEEVISNKNEEIPSTREHSVSTSPKEEEIKETITSAISNEYEKVIEETEISSSKIEELALNLEEKETEISNFKEVEPDKEDQEEIITEKSVTDEPTTSKESLALDEALESASKIEESLIKLNEKFVSENKDEVSEDIQTEDLSTLQEINSLEETRQDSSSDTKPSSKSSITHDKTPEKKIDVKKRVSEIMADANVNSRGDKSPRLQDLYVTAYDVGAANEIFEDGRQLPTNIFGSEAEELWRKQLAIEQEIKQLELQQKEQLPYVFMREIPNKPPPPYTPPSSLSSLPLSILPTGVKEINEITNFSSKVMFKAYQNNNLEKVKFSENSFKLFSKVEVAKICAEFMFNVCKDVARDHYKQFEKIEEPSWLTLNKKPQLTKMKPSDATGLERIMNRKLKELFGFRKVRVTESAIIRWGRKKRDHVDEILVLESQEEESQWTNFDKDELIVKDQITTDIIKSLIDETANIFSRILSKKKSVVG